MGQKDSVGSPGAQTSAPSGPKPDPTAKYDSRVKLDPAEARPSTKPREQEAARARKEVPHVDVVKQEPKKKRVKKHRKHNKKPADGPTHGPPQVKAKEELKPRPPSPAQSKVQEPVTAAEIEPKLETQDSYPRSPFYT